MVVIVILGILAATAMPKFVDLSLDAKKATAKGIAGALSSGAHLALGGCLVDPKNANGKCPPAIKAALGSSSCGPNSFKVFLQDGGITPAGPYSLGFTVNGQSYQANRSSTTPMCNGTDGPTDVNVCYLFPTKADFSASLPGITNTQEIQFTIPCLP